MLFERKRNRQKLTEDDEVVEIKEETLNTFGTKVDLTIRLVEASVLSCGKCIMKVDFRS